MKFVKILGLAAVAAVAMMAFAGASTASANVYCSTFSTPCNSKWPVGTEIDVSVPSGGSVTLRETSASGTNVLLTCTEMTTKETITNAGDASHPVTTSNSVYTWGNCNFSVNPLQPCPHEISKIGESTNGTVKASSECRITINTVLFGSCVYGAAAGTEIGTLTSGKPAHIDINGVTQKLTGSNLACPATTEWTGTLDVTSPSGTTLDVEPS